MTIASHTALYDGLAGAATIVSLATTTGVILQMLPVIAAVGSIMLSVVASIYYCMQIWDRIKSTPPK